MFTRPADLTDDQVLAAVRAGWGLDVEGLEHVPRGFGSHHWSAGEWFVTVDELTPGRLESLTSALSAARSLRDAGSTFVVAPEPSTSGAVVQRLGDRWAVAVYPYVEGDVHDWGPYPDGAARLAVLDLLVALHRAPTFGATVDDFAVPSRASLFDDLDGSWDTGPYGEQARELLAGAAPAVERALTAYDELVAAARTRPERMVLTHGEPHRANTITTATGPVLIDWESALVAPPERDLWFLLREDPEVLEHYGTPTDADALELYRRRWDLTEVSLFTADFKRPHERTADTRTAWENFEWYLERVASP